MVVAMRSGIGRSKVRTSVESPAGAAHKASRLFG
jgi:hypothetical protein